MTQQATARRGARPLALLACALLALCTASCAVLYGGNPGENPSNAETRQKAQKMHSIEDFQRDIEPTIIDARNKFINGRNIREYSSEDHIQGADYEGTTLYTLDSAQYFYEERDVDKVRSILNDYLTPLGFTMREKLEKGDHGTATTMVWYHEEYGATVSVLIADEGYSETHYGTEPLRSDGSTEDPERLLFQTARMPAGFDPGVIPKK